MAGKKQSFKKKLAVKTPVDVKSVWGGNMLQDGEWVSDGRLMFCLSGVVISSLGLASELMEDRAARVNNLTVQDKAWSLVKRVESNDTVCESKRTKDDRILVTIKTGSTKKQTYFSMHYWDLAALLTEFNKVVLRNVNSAAALYRDDDLVAVILPDARP